MGTYSDHPLALYVFSQDAAFKAKGEWVLILFFHCDEVSVVVFENTQSGACVANECVIHPGGTASPVAPDSNN